MATNINISEEFEELTAAERLEASDYDREFAYEEFLADCERRGVDPLD